MPEGHILFHCQKVCKRLETLKAINPQSRRWPAKVSFPLPTYLIIKQLNAFSNEMPPNRWNGETNGLMNKVVKKMMNGAV